MYLSSAYLTRYCRNNQSAALRLNKPEKSEKWEVIIHQFIQAQSS